MNTQVTSTTEAVITLIGTLPIEARKVIFTWLTEKQNLKETAPKLEPDDFWLHANSHAIEQIWGDKSDDIWDKVYQNHLLNGRIQTV